MISMNGKQPLRIGINEIIKDDLNKKDSKV